MEREYWTVVSELDSGVIVEYGADLHSSKHGSGFPVPSKARSEEEKVHMYVRTVQYSMVCCLYMYMCTIQCVCVYSAVCTVCTNRVALNFRGWPLLKYLQKYILQVCNSCATYQTVHQFFTVCEFRAPALILEI